MSGGKEQTGVADPAPSPLELGVLTPRKEAGAGGHGRCVAGRCVGQVTHTTANSSPISGVPGQARAAPPGPCSPASTSGFPMT